MMTIGTPISASGAKEYFKKDLKHQLPEEVAQKLLEDETDDSGDQNFGGFTDSNDVELIDSKQIVLGGTLTAWQGSLAHEFKLTGRVEQKDFNRLADGQHPQTRQPLIKHVKPRTKTKPNGKEIQTKSHRAGLDQTISAPKSVTLVALKDARAIKAHIDASVKAMKASEETTCAKMGNVKPPEKTSKALYAMFLHFDTRPEGKSGRSAPGLHCHFFEFNVAQTADGKYRALEMRENYRSQKLATAVYRSELHREMTALGYEMRVDDKTGAPEVAGISREYIVASSPRQNEIVEKAWELKIKSTKTVAANYRQKKKSDKSEMVRKFEELEKSYGHQATNAARVAKERAAHLQAESKLAITSHKIDAETRMKKAAEAVDFAVSAARSAAEAGEKKQKKFITRQSLLADALGFAAREITIREIRKEFTEREKRGELVEFDFDRRRKSFESKKATIADGQDNYEKSIGTTITTAATTAAVRHPRAEVSELASESTGIASLGNIPALSRAVSGTGKILVEEAGEKRTAKSNSDKPALPLHRPTRIGSAESSGETKHSGRRDWQLQRDGGVDQTNRSGEEIRANDSTNSGDKTEIGAAHQTGKIRVVENSSRNRETRAANRKLESAGTIRHPRRIISRRVSEEKTGGISDVRRLVEKYQGKTRERIEDRESFAFGTGDSGKQPVERSSVEDRSQKHTTGSDGRINPKSARKSQARRSFIGENARPPMGVGDQFCEMGESAGGTHPDDRYRNLRHDAESDRRVVRGSSGEQGVGKAVPAARNKQEDGGAEFLEGNRDAQSGLSERERLLQLRAGRAAKNHSKIDEESNRQIAAKTAQVINLKFFAGQLDERITDKWTESISKQPADQVLAELLLASEAKEEKRRLTAENLHEQTKGFAEDLKLPVPALPAGRQQRDKLLAEKLTEIQVKNYEAVNGEKIGAKTFEALVWEKLSLAGLPASAERHREVAENFKQLPAAPKFDSALEAETFAALTAPAAFGCNEEQINLTRKNVERNAAVSREAATLVQIAYGGQANIFNANFNQILADEIYYRYSSPVDIYNYVAGSNWQGTVKAFAPLIDNIAKQNGLQITLPTTDAERNKMLAEFATAQISEAYKSQHEQLFKWAENRLNADYQKSGTVSVSSSQQNDINKFAAENALNAPKFSSSLEADAYRLSKYDDEKKADYAAETVSAVEEKVKAEAAEISAIEQENALVLSM